MFGSGWAWLIYDKSGRTVSVVQTANQDTPAMEADKVPLLGLDVWEHAYYLKHQSKRVNYISDFWEVVDWQQVAQRYLAASIAEDGAKAEL